MKCVATGRCEYLGLRKEDFAANVAVGVHVGAPVKFEVRLGSTW